MTGVCSNCEREITKAEQAYVFNGMIVCAECDEKLRNGSGLQGVDLTASDLASPNAESTSDVSESAMDNDICEILGLDSAEFQAPEDRETSSANELLECYVCGKRFRGNEGRQEPTLEGAYRGICRDCFKERQKKLGLVEWSFGKRILIGLGLCFLGVVVCIFAIWIFLEGKGSLVGTAMAGGAFAIGGPAFCFGIRCLLGDM